MKKILYTIIAVLLPMVFIGQTNWTGTTDSDWQDASNWSAGIPDASDNVTIPSVANLPVIDNAVTVAQTNNLIIASGASVTIAQTGRLTVAGTLTNNAGTSGIIIQSGSGGTGSFIFSSASVSGTVDMFLSGTQFHYVSTPIDDITHSEFSSTDFLYWDASMEWDGTDFSPWITFTGTLVTGQGYANYESENTKIISGVLHQGSYNKSVSMSTGTVQFQGWNLVGNPYTSAIDWTLVDNTSANLDNAVYFYDGTQYASWISGAQINGGTNIIPPGQGFFVKCNSTSGGTLTFNNDDRVHNSQSFWKSSKPTSGLIKLVAQGNGFFDETLIRFIDGATDEYDGSYDAYKLISTDPDVPQIYSLNPSKTTTFSINSLPEISEEITIPLGFLVGPAGTYSISPSEMNLDAEYIYLEDLVEANVVDLVKNPTYIFDFPGGEANEDRFILRIMPKTASIDKIAEEKLEIYPNPSKGLVTFNIKAENDSPLQIEVFNLNGQKVYSETIQSGTTKKRIDLNSLPNGIYNVKVNFGDETAFKKLILMK